MGRIRKLWRIYTIIFCLVIMLFVLYFLKNTHFCPKGTIWTGSQCSGTGIIINNFVKGEILISFNDGTSYITAKRLLQNLNLNIQNTNSYWNTVNFEPTDETKLKTIDLFKIKVPVGDEDTVINKLKQFSLVRSAGKNWIVGIQ